MRPKTYMTITEIRDALTELIDRGWGGERIKVSEGYARQVNAVTTTEEVAVLTRRGPDGTRWKKRFVELI